MLFSKRDSQNIHQQKLEYVCSKSEQMRQKESRRHAAVISRCALDTFNAAGVRVKAYFYILTYFKVAVHENIS